MAQCIAMCLYISDQPWSVWWEKIKVLLNRWRCAWSQARLERTGWQGVFTSRLPIWQYGNMEMWKHGNMKKWKYENMEIWKHGNMTIWQYGNLAIWSHHIEVDNLDRASQMGAVPIASVSAGAFAESDYNWDRFRSKILFDVILSIHSLNLTRRARKRRCGLIQQLDIPCPMYHFTLCSRFIPIKPWPISRS